MKNPVRNVVVEYKNKRARKGNISLWGDLDLKSIAREVEADTPQAPMDLRAKFCHPEPIDNKAEIKSLDVGLQTATATEKIDDAPLERELSVISAPEPEKAIIPPNPAQKPEITGDIIITRNNRSVRRDVRKAMPQKVKKARHPVVETDIRAALLFLENENASLKRELIDKLRLENENLFGMLKRAEQRTTQSM